MSNVQICKYAVLTCLSEAEMLDFETLSYYSDFENTVVLTTLGKLLSWNEVRKVQKRGKNKEYQITDSGLLKLKYFKKHHYHNFWQPPWEEREKEYIL